MEGIILKNADLLPQLDEFVNENYCEPEDIRYSLTSKYLFQGEDISGNLDKFLDAAPAKETFSERISRLMYERRLSSVEVYNDLGMDRRHFSKIRTDKNYQPSKRTAILFAFALKLNLKETKELLDSAGFALSHSNKQDLVVEFFIENKIYDLMLLNEMLAERDLPLLLKCD